MTRISERRLAQVQAVTGLAFATFLLVHLVNTALATFGQGTYDGYQRAVRHYYQAPGLELVLVVLAPLLHVAAGLVRARRRLRKARERSASPGPLRNRLHRYAGYVLVLFFVGHVIATRGPGLVMDEPADFSFLTFSLEQYPAWFYPYYALFALAGSYHLIHGVASALPVLRARVSQRWLAPRSPRFWTAAGVAGALLLVGLTALGGLWFEVDTRRFDTWHEVWARFFPFAATER